MGDEKAVPVEHDPRESPLDDPRNADGESTAKQTEQPWQGNPEKDQLAKDRPKPDLEKWQRSKTH
ncbi:MAG: hypothetical protein JWQ82_1022 [Tardiphaga sp.]|nr:hypothetical protein [Tardiphaga sp.]